MTERSDHWRDPQREDFEVSARSRRPGRDAGRDHAPRDDGQVPRTFGWVAVVGVTLVSLAAGSAAGTWWSASRGSAVRLVNQLSAQVSELRMKVTEAEAAARESRRAAVEAAARIHAAEQVIETTKQREAAAGAELTRLQARAQNADKVPSLQKEIERLTKENQDLKRLRQPDLRKGADGK
jgi:hypothetical protein